MLTLHKQHHFSGLQVLNFDSTLGNFQYLPIISLHGKWKFFFVAVSFFTLFTFLVYTCLKIIFIQGQSLNHEHLCTAKVMSRQDFGARLRSMLMREQQFNKSWVGIPSLLLPSVSLFAGVLEGL